MEPTPQTEIQRALPPAEPNQFNQVLGWVKANPIPSGIGVLILIGMLTGGGTQGAQTAQQRGAIQSFRDQAEFSLKSEQEKMQFRDEQFKIATQRQKNCLPMTTDGKTPANVVEGMQVRDPASGSPLAAGTFVCDRYGATAELDAQGRMSNIMQGRPDPQFTLQAQKPAPAPTPTPQEIHIYAPASAKGVN
jgi:hypothetical protein